MKHLIIVIILACMLLILLLAGCGQAPVEPTSTETPAVSTSEEGASIATEAPVGEKTQLYIPPTQSVTVELSFPDEAPPLNQTRELRCTVNTPGMKTDTDISLNIQLPDAFELVSGELSWAGTVPGKSSIDVITAVVKSIKVGNWTINETHQITPKPVDVRGTGYGQIYISVSEDSAEWGKYPPWTREGGYPVQVVQSEGPVIIKEFSISHAPVLGEPADLTLTVLTRDDRPDSTLRIDLPEGVDLIDGSLEWHGYSQAGVPLTISAKIVFREPGDYRIDGGYWQWVGKENSWGQLHPIYLTIGIDSSSFAQPPEPTNDNRPIPPTTIEPADN
jgi:hypothetical protein